MSHPRQRSPRSLSLATFALLAFLPAVEARPTADRGGSSLGPPCAPEWIPTFGSLPALDPVATPNVSAVVFDDGSGPALFIGAGVRHVGGTDVEHVVKWDGVAWSPLGSGTNSRVRALVVYDDGGGGGPALYAGGLFDSAGGQTVNFVARWDGTSWSPLGAGLDGSVFALAVYDDGSGPALYAAGAFAQAGGVAASRIARWDGTSWTQLGAGLDAGVFALAVYDDGGGSALYAGGLLQSAGGAPASRVAKWDGSSWSTLGAGLNGPAFSMEVVDHGSGPGLYVGGPFTVAGAQAASGVARWDGSGWSALGGGLDSASVVLRAYDDGSGPALYAGGYFTHAGGAPARGVARWDGSSWSALGAGTQGGLDDNVHMLAVFDSGAGPVLHAAGLFELADDLSVNGFAAWDGASWSANWSHVALNGPVHAGAQFDDGSGPALFVAGSFSHAGTGRVNRVAKWDGTAWSDLAGGVDAATVPMPLYVHDDGSGSALYLGGVGSVGGVAVAGIARWDGASWAAVGTGPSGFVRALVEFDDGSGLALYAGGSFYDPVAAPNGTSVMKWDGASWMPVLGLDNNNWDWGVNALAVFDDGTGPALYAGGNFRYVNGVQPGGFARWDGTAWSQVGGIGSNLVALEVFDDGTGPMLYVSGAIPLAAGTWPDNKLGRWNGSAWSPLPSTPHSAPSDLLVLDDGNGPALHAAGNFTEVGGLNTGGVAKWDGTTWSALGAGIEGTANALVAFDDGSGPALFVGGPFTAPGGDEYLAQWRCTTGIGSAYCFGSPAACPCGNAAGPDEGCANSTGSGAVIAASGSASVANDDLGIGAANLPSATPVVLFGASNAPGGGAGVAFGDGLRCAGGGLVRLGARVSGVTGVASWGPGLAGQAGYAAGQTARFQALYRDTAGSPCGADFNLSHGLEVAFH